MLITNFLLVIYLRKNNFITSGDLVFVLFSVITIANELWNVINRGNDFMQAMGDFSSSLSILSLPDNKIDKKDARELVI